MRVQSEKPSENGGWVHPLTEDKLPPPPPPEFGRILRKPDPEMDQVYRKLLKLLPLNAKHMSQLRERKMSDSEIEKNMYRSLPENRERYVSQFDALDLAGIPGFGVKKGKWILSGKPGLLIPVIQQNLIVSLLIRPDWQEPGKKYQVLSSSWLEQGSSPGMRVHVAVPSEIHDPQTAWIVEGPLKADIVAERVGSAVFAVPGVNSWKELKKLPLPGTIIVAYDSDYENFHVRYHARGVSNYLIKSGRTAYAALWGGSKGPDDALVNNETIRLYRLFWRKLPEKKQGG
jgi:hypothetical protein